MVQSYSPGGANVHRKYRKPKNVCSVSAISAFCWLTTQTPSITNCLVTIVHTKQVIAIFLVLKLVAMVMSLRSSKSVMSCLHQIASPQKPTHTIKYRAASYHTTEVIAHRKPTRRPASADRTARAANFRWDLEAT